jgi:23S rRNA (cytosine1962-C5)-methyltransferase
MLPAWPVPDARFALQRGHQGTWERRPGMDEPWWYRDWFGCLKLELSPFGHIGLFPEQRIVWLWLRELGSALTGKRLLNLFAFTGGATLAALSLGAAVTHVDSAANTVERARGNARESGLADKPVRWIVEDAMKFTLREIRRGNRYDGVILDPPTYGHGTSRGQTWESNATCPVWPARSLTWWSRAGF